MTAGVPGLGLSGLFALLAALCLPLLRHNPRRSSWRLLVMALLIVVAAVLAWQSVAWLYSVLSNAHPGTAAQHLARSGQTGLAHPAVGQLLGVPVIVVSVVMMTVLLMAGEVLFRILGVRPTPLPPPIAAPQAHGAGADES